MEVQKLIDKVVEQMREDFANDDTTAIEVMLGTLAMKENLEVFKEYLSETGFDKEIIELKHLVDVFPRVCDATGKGMSEGWMFDDVYFSDQAEADRVEGKYPQYVIDYVKDTWGQTMEEFWAEVESAEDLDSLYYWSEWYELEDCADEAYLADGTLITEGDKGIFSDEKGNLYKIVDYKL